MKLLSVVNVKCRHQWNDDDRRAKMLNEAALNECENFHNTNRRMGDDGELRPKFGVSLVRSSGQSHAVDSGQGPSRRCSLSLSNSSRVHDAAINANLAVCLSSGAVTRYMSSLAAFVTDLAGRVERTSIGSGAIA